MMTVKEFINKLGGTKVVAEKLNLPVSTVSGWNISNSIPSWRVPALKPLAGRKRIEMPDVFAAPPAKPTPPESAAA